MNSEAFKALVKESHAFTDNKPLVAHCHITICKCSIITEHKKIRAFKNDYLYIFLTFYININSSSSYEMFEMLMVTRLREELDTRLDPSGLPISGVVAQMMLLTASHIW